VRRDPWSAGATSAAVAVTVADDDVDEPDEYLAFAVTAVQTACDRPPWAP
jgi:hypothetical protein